MQKGKKPQPKSNTYLVFGTFIGCLFGCSPLSVIDDLNLECLLVPLIPDEFLMVCLIGFLISNLLASGHNLGPIVLIPFQVICIPLCRR